MPFARQAPPFQRLGRSAFHAGLHPAPDNRAPEAANDACRYEHGAMRGLGGVERLLVQKQVGFGGMQIFHDAERVPRGPAETVGRPAIITSKSLALARSSMARPVLLFRSGALDTCGSGPACAGASIKAPAALERRDAQRSARN